MEQVARRDITTASQQVAMMRNIIGIMKIEKSCKIAMRVNIMHGFQTILRRSMQEKQNVKI